jgi:hypothetical protein
MSGFIISLKRVKDEVRGSARNQARFEELVLARVAAAYPILGKMSYDDFKGRYKYLVQELVRLLFSLL